MSREAANLPVNFAVPGNEAQERRHRATKALHKNISALMNLLAGLLELNIDSGIMPLPIKVKVEVLAFVVAAVIYHASLAFKDEDGDPDLAKLMHMISLLSGPLALVLEVVIIFPAFEWFAVMASIICTVITVAKSYQSIAAVVKRMYRSAVEELVPVFDKLKDVIRNYVNVG